MREVQPFNPFTSKLSRGITLVEASAGTGKTFSIAMVVVRAVVELGIPVDKILVVTFTIAATEELKERIRQRLSEARTLVKHGDTSRAPVEGELERWAAQLEDRDLALARLESALLDIDQAAIHTIHGFCQKILREQALETGHLFDVELLPDISPVRDQIVQDYWRTRIYGLEPLAGRVVLGYYATPLELYASIGGAEDELAVLLPDPVSLPAAIARVSKAYGQVRSWFKQNGEVLQRKLATAIESGFFKKDFSDNFDTSLTHLRHLFEANLAPREKEIGWLLEQEIAAALNRSKLRSPESREDVLNTLVLPGDTLAQYTESIAEFVLEVRVDLAVFLRENLPARLREQNSLSFDDLVSTLARAVTGTGSVMLCEQVGKRYRAALIDEFQDTDSAQWQVFSALFGTPRHYLYLIGDPKQAIYRFRGADIHSYFSARDGAATHYTLLNNYRSHPLLMRGINELFEGVEIGGRVYQSIGAARTKEAGSLVVHSEQAEPIVYCQLGESGDADGRWSASAANSRIQEWITAEIRSLTDAASPLRIACKNGAAGIVSKPVQPADIAILVRANQQAEMYQERLRSAGIPAVVSSRLSVFETGESSDLLVVLRAICSPGDVLLLRRAMSLDWFGLSGDEHFTVCNDEMLFNLHQERFQEYHQVWQDSGILPMFRRFLESEGVHLNLCRHQDAERRITNIEQLGELVQEAELTKRFRPAQTVQWLQEAARGAGRGEEAELRLESDAEAVTILTMHGAKGLEFPIVFCPSLTAVSYPRGQATLVFSHLDDTTRVCDLGSRNFASHQARALAEEREEDMRLAYVSVTRATLRSYLFWADIKPRKPRPDSFQSPLGQLLFPAGLIDFPQQETSIRTRAERSNCGYRLVETTQVPLPHAEPKPAQPMLQARVLSDRSLHTSRTITSFSGLARLSHHHSSVELSGAFDEAAESGSAETGAADLPSQALDDELPGGVRFGNVVHDILEQSDFAELGRGSFDHGLVDSLARHYNIGIGGERFEQLLLNTVNTKLRPGSTDRPFSLSELKPMNVVKELEFTLPLDRLNTGIFNDLLTSDPAFSALEKRTIEGYVSGYIDLVCSHDGSYYVIDYKTNRLGSNLEHYRQPALLNAMRSHNYGLQYWLYTLVVHRHLSQWQQTYSYAEHFGGVYYLFVRGMHPDLPGNGIFYSLPDQGRLEELDHYFGRGRDVRA